MSCCVLRHPWSTILETEIWECAVLTVFGAIGMKTNTGNRRRELLERLLTPDGKPKNGLETESSLNSVDVAASFEMTERAIRKLAAKGELPYIRTLGGGRLLYPASEIAALYAHRG